MGGRRHWEEDSAGEKMALGGRRRWGEMTIGGRCYGRRWLWDDHTGQTALGGQDVDEEDGEVGDKEDVVMTLTMRLETTRIAREMMRGDDELTTTKRLAMNP